VARKRNKKVYDGAKAQQGAARRAHFENGGTLATWRGRPARFDDRKKAARKAACRKPVRY